MPERSPSVLAAYTTLRLGGPPRRLIEVTCETEAVAAVRDATKAGDRVLVLAGGSNVVIADEGVDATVVLLRQQGVEAIRRDGRVNVTVAAGEPWDEVVLAAVGAGWSGIESLSGIPGSAGATPIQNVGAYGQEVAETLTAVRVYDRFRDEVVVRPASACGFAYRTSIFKHNDRFVVLAAVFSLAVDPLSTPIRYAELANALGVAPGERAPLPEVRAAVLKLRAGKGMVLDERDPDTYSVGSFFMNPVLDAAGYGLLRQRCTDAGLPEPAGWTGADGTVKVSAAWLIERAGFGKGYARPDTGVGVSAKHTLALTNRGGGSTAALLDLAREIRDGVHARFGVSLHPEPVLVNCSL